MAAKIFRINYKSDFILTLNSDAGWMTPFCIKFWTGTPSQAYYAYYDGMSYTHCAPVDGEPTKLQVQFDDHHLPIGDLKFQIAYHFTVADFPTNVEDEVLNQASVIIEVDNAPAQVMLDFTGETAPEIQFSLPAYANEAQRIANEEARIAAEQQRIANEDARIQAEEIRQQNEQQRIDQETARVNEFATLKSQSQAATRDANDAADLANQKAQLAADKAALAGAAATLANAKAQLAADKAALADAAATLANDKAALAQQKADYAQTQGDYAKQQGEIAEEDHERAEADHTRAESDHATAGSDHTQAGTDHTRAESDHATASADHTQAGQDHTRAESDHTQATSDHTQAGTDHTRAESDHTTASADHTQAGQDHTRAESDHTRAESDHAAVEVYVDSLGVFDLSKHNAVGGVLTTYANLDAALTALNALESKYKYGGMSFKFVQTYDNKYVQFLCTSDEFTTNVTNWQGVDKNPLDGSKNLIESGSVKKEINNNNFKTYSINHPINVIASTAHSSNSDILYVDIPQGDIFYVNVTGDCFTPIAQYQLWLKYKNSVSPSLYDTKSVNSRSRVTGATGDIEYISIYISGANISSSGTAILSVEKESSLNTIANNALIQNKNVVLCVPEIATINLETGVLDLGRYPVVWIGDEKRELYSIWASDTSKFRSIQLHGTTSTTALWKLVFRKSTNQFRGVPGSDSITEDDIVIGSYAMEGRVSYQAGDLRSVSFPFSYTFINGYFNTDHLTFGFKSIPNIDTTNGLLDLGNSPFIYIGNQIFNLASIWSSDTSKYRAIPLHGTTSTTTIWKLVFDTTSCTFSSIPYDTDVNSKQFVIGGFYLESGTSYSGLNGASLPFTYTINGTTEIKEATNKINNLYFNEGKIEGKLTFVAGSGHSSSSERISTYIPKGIYFYINVISDCLSSNAQYQLYVKYKNSPSLTMYGVFNANAKTRITGATDDIESIGVYVSAGYVTSSGTGTLYFEKVGNIDSRISELENIPKGVNYNAARQISRNPRTGNTVTGNTFVLGWFSDLHYDLNNLKTYISLKNLNGNISDLFISGDIIDSYWGDVGEGDTNTIDKFLAIQGASNILLGVGNHDAWEGNYHVLADPEDVYDRLFAPSISNWNVTHSGKNLYWYKDYPSKKIRLICLDCMFWDDTQKTWLETALADTLDSNNTAYGYHVICSSHYVPGAMTMFDSQFTSLQPISSATLNAEAAGVVDTFINNGGEFACWLCGHIHRDYVGVLTDHTNQIVISITTASSNVDQTAYCDSNRNGNPYALFAMELIGVDTINKRISVLRLGDTMDMYLRHRETMCIDYANKVLISTY